MQVWHFLELIDNQTEATRLIRENRKFIKGNYLPKELSELLERAEAELSLFRAAVLTYEVSHKTPEKEMQDG